jgi:hypothetical protein
MRMLEAHFDELSISAKYPCKMQIYLSIQPTYIPSLERAARKKHFSYEAYSDFGRILLVWKSGISSVWISHLV